MKPKDIPFNDWVTAYKQQVGDMDNSPPPGYLRRVKIMEQMGLSKLNVSTQQRKLSKMVEDGWMLETTRSRVHYYKPIIPKERERKRGHKKLSSGKNGDHGLSGNR